MRIWRPLTIALLMLFSIQPGTAASALACNPDQLTPITMGVPPSLTAATTRIWLRGLEQQLREHGCLQVKFGSDVDFAALVRAGRVGRYEAMIVPPHIGKLLSERYGFKRLARSRESSDLYALVVPAGSPIQTLAQLHGQRLALPDPLGVVSLAAEYHLAAAGVEARLEFVMRHDEVVAAVESGLADAAGVVTGVINHAPNRAGRWRVLMPLAPASTPHAELVVSPTVSPDLSERLRRAVLDFDDPRLGLMLAFAGYSQAEMAATDRAMAPYTAMLEKRLTATEHR